jgi:hypothetical protein
LLQVTYREAAPFRVDPSQMVRAASCRWLPNLTIDEALGAIPRDAFDYVWLVDPPRFDPRSVEGLEIVWSGPGSRLFRVVKAEEPRQ